MKVHVTGTGKTGHDLAARLLSPMRKIQLYARTLLHLKPWQVVGRVAIWLKRRCGFTRLPTVPASLRGSLSASAPFPQHDPWNTRREILQGRFCFLNEPANLGWPIDWRAADRSLLWQFNLHYFHYLHLLGPDEQVSMCRSWARSHPVGSGVAWHPYPTSLRIVNWCRAGIEKQDLLESLYLQAAYLYRNLETYIYGNHLLENARALVLAGRFFHDQGEAPRWLAKGLSLYRRETEIQILEDGGHYERSPMYHALMLEGYLDVINILPADHPDHSWLQSTVRRMSDALVSFLHPDGELALFNDTTQEISPTARDLLRYVRILTGYEPSDQPLLPASGYFIHRSPDLYMIVDGGPVGPDHLGAHAHADIFSYEVSLGGLSFVTDSGVYEYPAGAMRRYVRSTMAHNTVCVDGLDQVECWGSFRVARRSAPHDVTFSRREGSSHFRGTFSGYATLIGDSIRHHREIRVDERDRTIRVQDRIEGNGTHRIDSRVHLHPAVRITSGEGPIRLERGDVACRFEADPALVRHEQGWYCPRFGTRKANVVLALGGSLPLPATLSYLIRY